MRVPPWVETKPETWTGVPSPTPDIYIKKAKALLSHELVNPREIWFAHIALDETHLHHRS